MRDKLTWKWGAALAALLTVSAVAVASGEESHHAASSSGRVPLPVHSEGKGDKCVEDTSYMRRHHMELLKHHRDETMHQGIRTTKYSLKNCVECHANKETNSVLGKEGFCQSCHSYAAVKLDCFECHANKPGASAALQPAVVAPPAEPKIADGATK